MSGNYDPSDDLILAAGGLPIVPTAALWNWDTSSQWPSVVAFSNGQPTKSGLLPQDVKDFVGVPLGQNSIQNIFTPMPDSQILRFIRWAEDWIEQETAILLCQSWVAAPASNAPSATQNIGIQPASGEGVQVLGIDYDIGEAPYDFDFERAQDSGWMVQQLRYRPVKGPYPTSFNGLKNFAYIYPLLNTYFRVSASWFVTDPDFGLVRLVPATNIQMLPLFALQLSFQGFAQNVPGGIWMQYCAGLTPTDYNANYSFMQNLVLAVAAISALSVVQGTVSYGATDFQTIVDGLSERVTYNKNGPYAGLINTFENQKKSLMQTARSKIGGPQFTFL